MADENTARTMLGFGGCGEAEDKPDLSDPFEPKKGKPAQKEKRGKRKNVTQRGPMP